MSAGAGFLRLGTRRKLRRVCRLSVRAVALRGSVPTVGPFAYPLYIYYEHEWLGPRRSRSPSCPLPVWKRLQTLTESQVVRSRVADSSVDLVAPLTTTCNVEFAVAGLDDWMLRLRIVFTQQSCSQLGASPSPPPPT